MNRAGVLIIAMLLLGTGTARAADTVYYYSSDSVHSEVVITDANRNVVERTYYAPYGAVLNRDLRDGPGYAGHEEDPETGLVYMQQRYYDPETGQFLSTDPVQATSDGGNFNRYAYAADNPYSYYDPDGRMKDQDQERSPGCTGSLTPGGCGAVNMSSFIVDNSYRRGNSSTASAGSVAGRQGSSPGGTSQHGYVYDWRQCSSSSASCTDNNVWNARLHDAFPGQNPNTAVQDGKTYSVFGFSKLGAIRVFVDAQTKTITNVTEPTHIFCCGTVVQTQYHGKDGIYIDVEGTGTNRNVIMMLLNYAGSTTWPLQERYEINSSLQSGH